MEKTAPICVIGECTYDELRADNRSCKRLGGIAYSLRVIAKQGVPAASIGIGDQEWWSKFQKELAGAHQITPYTVSRGAPLTYRITSADETFSTQTYARKKNFDNCDAEIIEKLNTLPVTTKMFLIFPSKFFNPSKIIEFIKHRFESASVFLDLQHDLDSQDQIAEVLTKLGANDFLLLSLGELIEHFDGSISEGMSLIRGRFPGSIIAKNGIGGCAYLSPSREILRFPSFPADYVWTIGAGDVMAAYLATELLQGTEISLAVNVSQFGASRFIEISEENIFKNLEPSSKFSPLLGREECQDRISYVPVSNEERFRLYLAGSFKKPQNLRWICEFRDFLESRGFEVFSPSTDVGIIERATPVAERRRFFRADIEALEKCDLLIALLDCEGLGTGWEIGYSYATRKSKRSHALSLVLEDSAPISNMIENSTILTKDLRGFIRELFRLAKVRTTS